MKVKPVTKSLAGQPPTQLDPERRSLIGVASTGLVDRDGDVLEPGGWELANYLANPVVLWDHDASLPPVAGLLDHATPQVTAAVYAHAIDGRAKAAVENLPELA